MDRLLINGGLSGCLFIHYDLVNATPSWLVSSIGRALHRYRRGQGFESRTSLISGFRFGTAKVASITAMIFFHISHIILYVNVCFVSMTTNLGYRISSNNSRRRLF